MRIGALNRALTEDLDLLVELQTQPRDLILARVQPELDRAVDLAGQGAVDVSLLNFRDQSCSARRRGSGKLGEADCRS